MAKTLKGTLSGLNLMQIVKMSVPVPCKIEYAVHHKGSGNNKLRVRCGSFYHLAWSKVHDIEIQPGKSKSRTIEEKNDDTGPEDNQQDIRWRLSRTALSKAIDWELTYKVILPKGGSDVTSKCKPKLTEEA